VPSLHACRSTLEDPPAINFAIKAIDKKLPDNAIIAHLGAVIGLTPDLAQKVLEFVKGYRTPPE
jgi:hypothetical protein